MLSHLMPRKQGNRERLKERERMMVTWNLMMLSSLLQVSLNYLPLLSFISLKCILNVLSV